MVMESNRSPECSSRRAPPPNASPQPHTCHASERRAHKNCNPERRERNRTEEKKNTQAEERETGAAKPTLPPPQKYPLPLSLALSLSLSLRPESPTASARREAAAFPARHGEGRPPPPPPPLPPPPPRRRRRRRRVGDRRGSHPRPGQVGPGPRVGWRQRVRLRGRHLRAGRGGEGDGAQPRRQGALRHAPGLALLPHLAHRAAAPGERAHRRRPFPRQDGLPRPPRPRRQRLHLPPPRLPPRPHLTAVSHHGEPPPPAMARPRRHRQLLLPRHLLRLQRLHLGALPRRARHPRFAQEPPPLLQQPHRRAAARVVLAHCHGEPAAQQPEVG
ncbi:hypothetical protein EE612_055323 [Oryza sativa]|nr:hypothetical protein EE612_055323 [Oryza sativa]